jgi:hypothetical protein
MDFREHPRAAPRTPETKFNVHLSLGNRNVVIDGTQSFVTMRSVFRSFPNYPLPLARVDFDVNVSCPHEYRKSPRVAMYTSSFSV